MSGMLSFLFASGIFALIGTALRGLIRPISWSLFALATFLAASQQFFNEAQNEIAVDPIRSEVDNPSEVNASVAPVPTASVTLPIAVEGWQNLPRQLEPAVDQVLDAAMPSPTPDITIASDPTPVPSSSRATDPPASPSVTRSTASPAPIQGFW